MPPIDRHADISVQSGFIWPGETREQRLSQRTKWHIAFAWWPTQMDDGRWIWLGQYAIRWSPTHSGRGVWQRRLMEGGWKMPPEDDRPAGPPPKPGSK